VGFIEFFASRAEATGYVVGVSPWCWTGINAASSGTRACDKRLLWRSGRHRAEPADHVRPALLAIAHGVIEVPADYGELGWLLIAVALIGVVLPLGAIALVQRSRLRTQQ